MSFPSNQIRSERSSNGTAAGADELADDMASPLAGSPFMPNPLKFYRRREPYRHKAMGRFCFGSGLPLWSGHSKRRVIRARYRALRDVRGGPVTKRYRVFEINNSPEICQYS